jgi:DNA-binding NtrC family response regulator
VLPVAEPAQLPAAEDTTLQVRVGSSIAEMERRLILATLDQLEGDKKRAAELLGISLKTLYTRLSVYAAAARDRDESSRS